jgi:hypothetical protein
MIDPIRFIQEVLVNPETGRPFELVPAECDFLSRAFRLVLMVGRYTRS